MRRLGVHLGQFIHEAGCLPSSSHIELAALLYDGLGRVQQGSWGLAHTPQGTKHAPCLGVDLVPASKREPTLMLNSAMVTNVVSIIAYWALV